MILKIMIFAAMALVQSMAWAEEQITSDHQLWSQHHQMWQKEHEAWRVDHAQWKKDRTRINSAMKSLKKILKSQEEAMGAHETEIKNHEFGIKYHAVALAKNKITDELREGHFGGKQTHEKFRNSHATALAEHQQLMAAIEQLERIVKEYGLLPVGE